MSRSELLEEVLEAHGGRSRWQCVETIEASFSSGGLAFAAHLQPFALRDLRISVSPHARRVVLRDFVRREWRGVWTPDLVQIRDGNDVLVAERREPRSRFRDLMRKISWDRLDILYFAGYALWNYLSFPFLLELPGVTVAELPPAGNDARRRLVATFDTTVATHCAIQSFHLDEARCLMRHDYTADVIGTWATAANLCLDSELVAGIRFYTRRVVHPRIGVRTVLPFPTLVWIRMGDIHVTRAATSPATAA